MNDEESSHYTTPGEFDDDCAEHPDESSENPRQWLRDMATNVGAPADRARRSMGMRILQEPPPSRRQGEQNLAMSRRTNERVGFMFNLLLRHGRPQELGRADRLWLIRTVSYLETHVIPFFPFLTIQEVCVLRAWQVLNPQVPFSWIELLDQLESSGVLELTDEAEFLGFLQGVDSLSIQGAAPGVQAEDTTAGEMARRDETAEERHDGDNATSGGINDAHVDFREDRILIRQTIEERSSHFGDTERQSSHDNTTERHSSEFRSVGTTRPTSPLVSPDDCTPQENSPKDFIRVWRP